MYGLLRFDSQRFKVKSVTLLRLNLKVRKKSHAFSFPETTWEIIFERIKSYFSHNNRKVVEALLDANIKIIGRYALVFGFHGLRRTNFFKFIKGIMHFALIKIELNVKVISRDWLAWNFKINLLLTLICECINKTRVIWCTALYSSKNIVGVHSTLCNTMVWPSLNCKILLLAFYVSSLGAINQLILLNSWFKEPKVPKI